MGKWYFTISAMRTPSEKSRWIFLAERLNGIASIQPRTSSVCYSLMGAASIINKFLIDLTMFYIEIYLTERACEMRSEFFAALI